MKPFAYLAYPVRVLLWINAIVFAFFSLAGIFGISSVYGLSSWMVLIPERAYEAWRWVTYAFLHLDPFHFLFNMLMLWMFGDELAEWLGNRQFWGLYCFGAVVAAWVSIPFYAADWIGGRAAILGASGALFALLVAYARLFPDRQILMFFFFPMRIRYAIWVLIAIDLLLSRTHSGIAHFTHLGGALAGWLFMLGHDYFVRRRERRRSGNGEALTGYVGYLDEEQAVDVILAKVSRRGIQSLSPEEIEILQKASARRRRFF